MTSEQVIAAIKKHIRCNKVYKQHDKYYIIDGDCECNYETLAALSKEISTTKINFCYREGSPGYSSWTPSSPGSFTLEIIL